MPPKSEDASGGVSDFDKLLENNTNDEENSIAPIAPISAPITAAVAASPPVKAVKKKTVRASQPMKFKITKVILKNTHTQKQLPQIRTNRLRHER